MIQLGFDALHEHKVDCTDYQGVGRLADRQGGWDPSGRRGRTPALGESPLRRRARAAVSEVTWSGSISQ